MRRKSVRNSYAVENRIQNQMSCVAALLHAKDYMIEHGKKPDHFQVHIPNGAM